MTKMINFSNLDIAIEERDSEVIYNFRGDVDENFRQEDVPRIKKDRIIFNLELISNFNSCGIREWIYFVKDMGELGELEFRNCSVTMIDQINMVPDSLGTGHIYSFFAPYYCTNHGEVNQLIVFDEQKNALNQKQAPDFNCPHCGKTLEFDALEESYFLFTDTSLKSAS